MGPGANADKRLRRKHALGSRPKKPRTRGCLARLLGSQSPSQWSAFRLHPHASFCFAENAK